MSEPIAIGHASADDTAVRLLTLIEQLVAESHPQRRIAVALDSSFERDLGLDSLGRVELLLRTERAFGVSLPDYVLNTAETPRDLVRIVLSAHGAPPCWRTGPSRRSPRAASKAFPNSRRHCRRFSTGTSRGIPRSSTSTSTVTTNRNNS